MSAPTISLIIPVYNAENYIKRCIDSLINQIFTDFELILVDDGSSDLSLQICDEYSYIDRRIKVFHRDNSGAAAARNFGLKNANGSYIMFVDADDYVDQDYLQIMHKWISKEGCDIVQCDYVITQVSECVFQKGSGNIEIENGRKTLERFFDDRVSSMYVFWNKIYRKQIWDGIQIPEGMICEDQAILHELYYRANKVGIIHDQLYAYFMTNSSVMRCSYTLKNLDIIKAFDMRRAFIYQNKLNEYYDLFNKTYLWALIRNYALTYKFLKKDEDLLQNLRAKIKLITSSLLYSKTVSPIYKLYCIMCKLLPRQMYYFYKKK